MKRLTLLCFFTLSFSILSAQTASTEQPRKSPAATVSQKLGLTQITIDYHRPAVKEREVWGKLVPFASASAIPWRAGANENTVIHFSEAVKIEGESLAAGTYGLHMLVEPEEVTLIFSNNSTSWGSFSYNKAEDALRVSLKPIKEQPHVEFLSYTFENIAQESVSCQLNWGTWAIPFKIETNVHEQVIASLKNQLRDRAGWTWLGWHEAATYCLNNEVELQQGLRWATRSVYTTVNGRNLLVKAKLTAKLSNSDQSEEELIMATLEQDLSIMQVDWKAWNAAANYGLRQKKFLDKSLAFADASIAMDSNMTNLGTKASILMEQGEEKQADMVIASGIANATNAELNNYGYQLMWSGRTKKAVEIFEANAKKNPNDPNVHDSLGEGYMQIGEKKKAIASLKRSLSLNPPANVKSNSLKLLQQLGVDDYQ